MFLKLMSDEPLPDHDSRKRFRLLDGIKKVVFQRGTDGATVEIHHDDARFDIEFLTGNAYLMNDQGKTIQSFDNHYTREDQALGSRTGLAEQQSVGRVGNFHRILRRCNRCRSRKRS